MASAYTLSELSSISSINNSALIELSTPGGDNNYISKKATIKDFGNYLISSHSVFNNLDIMFNTNPDNITFTQSATFKSRPTVVNATPDIDNINYNQLLTKGDIQAIVNETGLAIPAVGIKSAFKQYNNQSETWEFADAPTVNSTNNVESIYSKEGAVPLSTQQSVNGLLGFASNPIMVDKNTLLTVVANILLYDSYDALSRAPIGYYRTDMHNWVALLAINKDNNSTTFDYDNNNVLQVERFTDILNVNTENQDLAVAQIIMHVPVAKDTYVSLFTPANINTNTRTIQQLNSNLNFQKSLYSGINSICFNYYDQNI